jgi:outer membrane receptor protein involved in Fe transport
MPTLLCSGAGTRYTVAAVATLLLLPAELPAHEDDTPADLGEITVFGRSRNLIGEASSAAEGRVGQAEIEVRPLLRPGELLELVPGMIVTQHSGTGKSNQMFLRGFNLDHGTDFATWVDGMPVNLRSQAHGQGYTDINFIIPEMVQELEYRKGPYYAEIGDFSSAGSAQFNTYKRLDRTIVKGTAGEDNYRRGLLAGSNGLGPGMLTFAGEAMGYDGPWVDIKEDLKKYNGLARYSVSGATRRWDVTLMGYDAKWNSADQIPQRAVEEGLVRRLGSIDNRVGGKTHRYSLSTQFVQDWESSQTRVNLYAIDYKLELYSNFTYFLDDPVNGDEFEQSEKRRIYGGLVEQHYDASLFGRNVAHRIGLEFRYDDIDDVGLYQTVARRRLDTVREDDVDEASAALYYAADVLWSERLRTVLGLRYDYYDFDVDSDDPRNSGSDNDHLWSPKFSGIYTASDSVELYLNAGKGFHSNDARGTTISVDPKSGEPVDPVDPLVESEGAEIGLRWVPGRILNTAASLWYLELDSELLYVGDAGTTEPSTKSERWGVEVANFIRPTDWLTLDVDYAWTDAELKDNPDGNKIPGSIETVLSAGASVDFPSGWGGTLRARYFDERPLSEDGSVESDDFLTFNAQLRYDRGPWRATLDVLNLFDDDENDIEYFYASRLPGEPAAGVEDIHFHPVEPRTVRFNLSYSFGGDPPDRRLAGR